MREGEDLKGRTCQTEVLGRKRKGRGGGVQEGRKEGGRLARGREGLDRVECQGRWKGRGGGVQGGRKEGGRFDRVGKLARGREGFDSRRQTGR